MPYTSIFWFANNESTTVLAQHLLPLPPTSWDLSPHQYLFKNNLASSTTNNIFSIRDECLLKLHLPMSSTHSTKWSVPLEDSREEEKGVKNWGHRVFHKGGWGVVKTETGHFANINCWLENITHLTQKETAVHKHQMLIWNDHPHLNNQYFINVFFTSNKEGWGRLYLMLHCHLENDNHFNVLLSPREWQSL